MASFRLVFDRITRELADVVYANKDRARELWLVTPWLSLVENGEDPIALIVDSLSRKDCHTYVVTRPPTEHWHASAVDVIRKNIKSTFFYSRNLHAKIYLLECDGFSYALLGSPNLTGPGNIGNREVAVEFRTGSALRETEIGRAIEELRDFVRQLSLERDVVLADV